MSVFRSTQDTYYVRAKYMPKFTIYHSSRETDRKFKIWALNLRWVLKYPPRPTQKTKRISCFCIQHPGLKSGIFLIKSNCHIIFLFHISCLNMPTPQWHLEKTLSCFRTYSNITLTISVNTNLNCKILINLDKLVLSFWYYLVEAHLWLMDSGSLFSVYWADIR